MLRTFLPSNSSHGGSLGNHPWNSCKHDIYTTVWDSKTKKDAMSYKNVLTDVDFIVALIFLYRFLTQ